MLRGFYINSAALYLGEGWSTKCKIDGTFQYKSNTTIHRHHFWGKIRNGRGWSQNFVTPYLKAHSYEQLNHSDSVTGRLAWIAGSWATSDCVFKHSVTMNRKRVCSSLRKRWQNDEILQNSSNYLFRRAIQSSRLATGCQILNMFKVKCWLLRHRNSVAATGSCVFTPATTSLAFLQWRNGGDSVARVNGPSGVEAQDVKLEA